MWLTTATNSQRLNRRIVVSDNKLLEAINHMESLPDSDKINIKGKLYAQVTTRVVAFRKAYGDRGRITTKIHTSNENRVLIEAQIHVRDGDVWHLISNDWAEEFRNDGPINKKSATENCATSAIGRALAALGLGGGEYASGDEVQYAIEEKQGVSPKTKEKSKPAKADVVPTSEDFFKQNADVLIDELASVQTPEEAKAVMGQHFPSLKKEYEGHPDWSAFSQKIKGRLEQIATKPKAEEEDLPF
jgi:hypothetical protein